MSKLKSLCWSLLGHLGLVSFVVLSLSPATIAAPVVRIEKPQSGQTVLGETSIKVAFRADDDKPIEAIQLYVDSKLARHWRLPVPKLEGTQSFLWDFSFASGTTHTVMAKAIDTAGREGRAEIVVHVHTITTEQPDQIPPIVNVYYPAQGAEAQGEIELKANATDNIGVNAVFFYVDGNLHTMIMNAPPYVAKWDTTKATDGPHVIKASASDKAENRTDSAEVTVLVANRSRTAANISAAEAGKVAGAEQASEPKVAAGPIADTTAGQQPSEPSLVEQAFGQAAEATVAALPDESMPRRLDHRISQPTHGVTARPPAPAVVEAVAATEPSTEGAMLVRLPTATTAKSTGEAAQPTVVVQPLAKRYAMTTGWPSGTETSAAASSVDPGESVEYLVAMLPGSGQGVAPYGERVSKPATSVSLPKEIGELRDIAVVFDGKTLELRAAPEVRASIPMGALREVFEQTDGILYWFAAEKRVRAINKDVDMDLQIGDPCVSVNDQQQELILAPYIKCGRTMVPLQFLADSLDVAIRYNPATDQLVITSNEF